MFIVFAGVLFGPVSFVALLGVTGSYTAAFLLTMIVAMAAFGCLIRANNLDRTDRDGRTD
jgi:hypothetical protein